MALLKRHNPRGFPLVQQLEMRRLTALRKTGDTHDPLGVSWGSKVLFLFHVSCSAFLNLPSGSAILVIPRHEN